MKVTMTKRLTTIILTCITVLATVVPLTACAPQTAEPAFLEKIENAMIFVSQGDGQDNDLSIEAIVPDADSPEVLAYLDKLRTDNGQDVFKYNFDYVKEVMQMDSATIDDALYDALILIFTEMPDEDKETFLECAYLKAGGKCDVSAVLKKTTERYKELLKNANISFYELSDKHSDVHKLIFSYSLLKQVCIWDSLNLAAEIKVDIARKTEGLTWDAALSVGRCDNKGDITQILKRINMYQFKETLSGIISSCNKKATEKGEVNRIKILTEDRRVSMGLNMGASVSIDDEGKYDVYVAALDTFQLNLALRTYAIEHGGLGSEGLGYTAEDIAKALEEGMVDDLGPKSSSNNKSSLEQFVDWYVGAIDAPEAGGGVATEQYKNNLINAYEDSYVDTYKTNNTINDLSDDIQLALQEEASEKLSTLSFEQMRLLEKSEIYGNYFD